MRHYMGWYYEYTKCLLIYKVMLDMSAPSRTPCMRTNPNKIKKRIKGKRTMSQLISGLTLHIMLSNHVQRRM